MTLGLTKPNEDKTGSKFKATDLVDLYKNNGEIIFQRRSRKSLESWKSAALAFALNVVGARNINPEDLFNSKYTRKGKIDIINEYFANTYMKEALTEILITSYATNLRLPLFFTSNMQKEQKYKKSENFCMVCEGYKMGQAALAPQRQLILNLMLLHLLIATQSIH
ncbi:hypothetical protein [Iningainema tapete]|uniref:hypothetical protein n=1 Tax=Iningainema tapete TaxID=2806730 RepID=UPI001EE198FD|nr:hypothetical protein [Iningainema tapete]